MLKDPLLRPQNLEGKKNECLMLLIFCFTVSLVAFISKFNFSQLTSSIMLEESVGAIHVGSFVRVRTHGRTGLVTMIKDHKWVHLYLLDSPEYEPRYLIRRGVLEELPFQQFIRDANNTWPFWDFIKQDPWYTEHTCLGPLPGFCRPSEHNCQLALPMVFQRLLPTIGQTAQRIYFAYGGVDFNRDQNMFLEFVRVLFGCRASRLYVIRISAHHTFLIEQYDNEFRIYQSWSNGFDLQYWTNSEIDISTMCEPGEDVSRAFAERSDPDKISFLKTMGIEDDSESIKSAKRTYGCLRSIAYIDIIELFLFLSVGFQMQSIKNKFGKDALIASANTLLYSRSKRILGKSAISLKALTLLNIDFSITITFIDSSH